MRINCTRREIPKDRLFVIYNDIKITNRIHANITFTYKKTVENWINKYVDVKTERIILLSTINALDNEIIQNEINSRTFMYFASICCTHLITFIHAASINIYPYKRILSFKDLVNKTYSVEFILNSYIINTEFHNKKWKYYMKQIRLIRKYTYSM